MPRQSRTKIAVLFVLLLLLVVVGTVSYLGWRQSVDGPTLASPPPRVLGHKATFPIVIQASRGNVVGVEINVTQAGKTTTVVKLDGPQGPRVEVPVTIEAAALKLREGEATLDVRARDDFWRPLRLEVGTIGSLPLRFDLTPPRVEVLGSTQYVSNGGVALVAFRVDGATATEVAVGTLLFPSFPAGPAERGARVALIALPWDMPPGTPAAIRARDDAGNVASRGIPFELKPRRFARDTIQVSDAFLQLKVPELLPQHPPSAPLIEGFLIVNRDQRKQAEDEKRKIGARTADKPLWQGAFVQPRNTKVFSNFAETRTYIYQGREIDTQVHFGYDLASTKASPVPAANSGVVAFAGPLTIYGNTVVVDHGLGLQTLYAHLSSFGVKVGDKVEKGQELGRSGTTGLAIGDHLHYETLVHGISVTPVEWWDAKWIRDRIALPWRTAGLGEFPGIEAAAGAADSSDERPTRPSRRRAR